MASAAKMSPESSQVQQNTNKKRSVVWLNFTLQGKVAICNYCKYSANYNPQTGATSNLLKHLRVQHPEQLGEEANQSKKVKEAESEPKVAEENRKSNKTKNVKSEPGLLKKKEDENDDDDVSGKTVKILQQVKQEFEEPMEDGPSVRPDDLTKSGLEVSMHVDNGVTIEEVPTKPVHSTTRQEESTQARPISVEQINQKVIRNVSKPRKMITRKMMMGQETSSMAPNGNNPAGLMAPKPTQPILPRPSGSMPFNPMGPNAPNPILFYNREVKTYLIRIEEKIDWIMSGMQSSYDQQGENGESEEY